MLDLGFKIVERSRSEIEPVVARALEDRRPFEVGLYFGDPAAVELLLARLPGSGLPLAAHLDHRRLSVLGLEASEPLLREQLALAARLGAAYVITHLSPYPLTPRLEWRKPLLDKLFGGLRFLAGVCAEYGLDAHIENTYHDLAFYRHFFHGVLARGIERIHVCFDLGHAKVWSTERLDEWLGFLSTLRDDGLRLHFHLHANRGFSDEHLSFLAAERLGITAADAFTGGRDYYRALADITERFPAASKVFEVPAQEAVQNLEHVLHRIASVRSALPAV